MGKGSGRRTDALQALAGLVRGMLVHLKHSAGFFAEVEFSEY